MVKELVENSIDAGATEITVVVEKGGQQLIQVTDNGSGISAKELPIAFERYSTSKIGSVDDLFNIDTLNVAPTHTNGRSRITATLNGDEKALDQISRSRSRKMRAAPDALGPRCPPSGHDRPPQGR